jgi:hypothetical protein
VANSLDIVWIVVAASMTDPFDPLCTECGLPLSFHTRDADVEDEQARIAEFRREVAVRVEEKLAERKYIAALVEWKIANKKGLADQTSHPDSRIRNAANLKFIADYDAAADFSRRVETKMLNMRIARGEMPYEPMTKEEFLAAKERFWSGEMKTASRSDPNPPWRRYETKTAFPEDVQAAREGK